jgi:hypothetical protein
VSELRDKLDKVNDRASFLDFARALAIDRADKASNGWESSTIEEYLDAAVSWAEDSGDSPTGLSTEPSWRGFATFLYCGKIYE